MTAVAADEYQQYSAPRENETSLVQPGQQELLAELRKPTFAINGAGLEFCGKSLEVARRQAREEVVRKSLEYTGNYLDLPERTWDYEQLPPIILSGHQPELFHAGVWFKSFLLSGLAFRSGAIAINFLVDNDVCRGSAIRVPCREAGDVYVAKSVLFDSPSESVPWELRRLESIETWQQFPASVKQVMLPGKAEPLLAEIWPDAIEAVRRSDRLGLAIAEARHRLEQRIGLRTLEVPLSHMVSTRAFARFSIQLLSELPRFQEIYNSQLAHYRRAHRIRSHAHPVPALEQEQGWLEAPWWIYRSQAPQRRRLWVRVLNNQLILSDRAGWQAVVEGRLDCDNAASQWLDLLADGVCLRPRALLTTMYLRIMVSDLFLHGIGGGKYDQLTDGIVREFFGILPPPMAVATATLQLPFASRQASDSGATEFDASTAARNRREQKERLWQLRYHADRFVAGQSAEARLLADKKRELLANMPTRGEKWQWHREITSVNRRLSELTEHAASQSRLQLELLAVQERHARVLNSREYSFCLFPCDYIARQLHRLSAS